MKKHLKKRFSQPPFPCVPSRELQPGLGTLWFSGSRFPSFPSPRPPQKGKANPPRRCAESVSLGGRRKGSEHAAEPRSSFHTRHINTDRPLANGSQSQARFSTAANSLFQQKVPPSIHLANKKLRKRRRAPRVLLPFTQITVIFEPKRPLTPRQKVPLH